MAIIVGSGDYRYEQIDNWAKVPPGWSIPEVGAVGVDNHELTHALTAYRSHVDTRVTEVNAKRRRHDRTASTRFDGQRKVLQQNIAT